MTLYTNISVVESPLSYEMGPRLRIRKRDIPGYADPVQSRMLLILALAVAAIAVLSVLLATRVSAADPVTVVLVEAGAPAHGDNTPVSFGGLSSVFTREVLHWRPQILRWADEHDLNPNIVATIMQIESCGDPNAVSSAGARGLFQVMPFHFTEGEIMLDPETNARRGLNYYRQQMRETEGNVFLSFAGYNGGSAASSSHWDNWHDETRRYYVWSKGIFEEAEAGLSSSPTLDRWLAAGGASLCRQAASRLGVQ